MKRRIFSILTALALCLGLLPLRAFAADAPVNNPVLDISEGGIFISKDTKGSDLCAYRQIKSDDDNKPFIPYTGAITITGTSKSWYNLTVIGVEATIRLQNARIAPTVTQDNNPGGLNALNIQRGAKVDLILEGTSTLKGSGSFRREHEGVAGILISEDSSTGASVLRISGIGTLNVEGGDSVRQVPSASSSPLEGGNGITFAGQAGLHVMGNATVNITGGNTGLARQYQGNGIWAEPSASSGGASLELSGGAMSVKGRFGCYMREAFQLRQTGGTFSMEGSGGFYSPDTAYQVEVSGGSMDVHSYGAEAIDDLGKLTVGGKDTSVTLSTNGIRTDAVGGKTQFTVSPEVGYAAILKSGANEASAGRTPYPEETALSSVKGKYVNVTFSNERKNLTVTDGGAGSSGSGSYLPGQTVDISAGTLEGKSFKWWEHVSGDGRIANTGAADSTFTMGWEDAVIRPAFVTGHIFGEFAVNAEDDKIGDCSYNDGVLTISGSGTYAVSMATPGTTTGHRILLSGGSPTVILDSVLISSGSNSAIGLAYDKTTNATLMLSGTSVLSAATNGTTPGIAVWTNSKYAHASLTITSLKGDGNTDGRLEVSGGNGIGASGIRAAGNITIKGGTIIARGSGQTLNGGCGVGSTKGGRVTISGGDITATVSGGKFVQQAFCGGPTLENDPSIVVNGSFAHRVSGTNVRIYYDSQGGSSVRSVAVDPQSGAILAGETLQFTAQVEGGGNATKTVAWSVSGASSAGTSIDANGLLTVAPDETAEVLTVTATNDYSGMSASAGVTVERQSVFYSVTVETDGNGTASASPVSAEAGTEIALTVTPGSGSHFKEWQVISGGVTISGDSFIMPAENVTVKAVFEQDTPPEPETYTVTVQTEGSGTASASPASAEAGTEITLTAVPDSGYHFKEWQVVSGGVTISDDKFTMPGENVTVKAVFEQDTTPPDPPDPPDPPQPETYTVTVWTEGGGTASASPASAEAGTEITLTAVPDSGYHFKEWQVVSGGVTVSGNSFTMPAGNVTVKAVFERDSAPTPPDPPPFDPDRVETAIEVKEGISEVPEGLSGIPALNTPAKLNAVMKTEITRVNPDIPLQNTAVYDVTLMISTDGGATWTPATADNFPSGGLTVTLPYPGGTNSRYRFTVVHMFTTSDFGKTPGDTERPAVTNAENGIRFTVTGLSPISVGWTAPAANPDTPSGGNHGGGGGWSASSYAVTVEKPEHGKVTSNRTNASPNSTVTLTVTPDSGYELDTLTVTDDRGNEIRLTDQGGGRYTFTMPGRAITVKAVFAPLPGDTQKLCDGGADCPSRGFTDLGSEGTWYHEAVDYVLGNGLMGGYGNGTFGPSNNLSRAQFAQILFNLEGRPVVNYLLQYGDVAEGAWYTEAIRWAASQGIIGGYSGGIFGPNDSITREQLAVMLWRYAGSPAATDKELRFTDADKAGGYALEALRWAVENSVMSGRGGGILDPKGLVTRAQAAQMLMNFQKK